MPRIKKIAGINDERMAEILKSHVIEPPALLADDFGAFFQARRDALLNRIEAATGKPIAREVEDTAGPGETAGPEEYEAEEAEEVLA